MRRPPSSPTDRDLLALAVPALGALVAEPLFLLVDAAIVGHLGAAPLAGLGLAGTVLSTLVNLCIFLAYGTTAAVARQLGAGDEAGAFARGVAGVWLAVGVGVPLALVALAAAPLLPLLPGAGPQVGPYAVSYLRWSAPGIPAMLVVLAGTGILRGWREVRWTLGVAVAGAAGNAVLNYLLVYPAGWGIAGSAVGTALTQTGMAGAYLVRMARIGRPLGGGWRPAPALLRASVGASLALLLRTVALRVYLLAGTAFAASFGTAALAAHTVVSNLWNLLALVLDALAIAAQVVIGRALGAGDRDGARALLGRLLRWGVGAGVLCTAAVLAVRGGLGPLFTADPATARLVAAALVPVALLQPVGGVVFVLDGVLIGAGDGRYLAWAGLATTAVFLSAATLAAALRPGLTGLWWAVAAFMIARLVALLLRARSGRWVVTGAER